MAILVFMMVFFPVICLWAWIDERKESDNWK